MNKNKLLWILFLLININNCIVYCNKEISREDYHFSHDKMINNQKNNDDKSNLETEVSDNQTKVSDKQTKVSDDDNNNNQNEEKDKKNKDQILNDQNINQEVIVEDADKKPELHTNINSLPLVPEKNNSNDNKQKKKNYISYIIPSLIIFYLIYRFIIKDRDKIFIENDEWVQLFNGSDIISKDLIHTITIENTDKTIKKWVKNAITTRYNNNVRIKKAIGEYWAEDNITIPLLTEKCFNELLNYTITNKKQFIKNQIEYKNIKINLDFFYGYNENYEEVVKEKNLIIEYFINECCFIFYEIKKNDISLYYCLNVFDKRKKSFTFFGQKIYYMKEKRCHYTGHPLYEIKQTTTNQDLQKNFQLARELYKSIFTKD